MPVLRLQWPPVPESRLMSWQSCFPQCGERLHGSSVVSQEGVCGGWATGRIAAVTRAFPGAGFLIQGAVFVLQPRDFHSVLQMVLEEVPEPVR